jgi:2-polyprenyl-3-methyl-5-hydroxy-6-metoxy-1,4-benzoquinol methylase
MQNQYCNKTNGYFSGIRKDYIDELPVSESACILEIGCGAGDTGRYALEQNKCGLYYGIELCEKAAAAADARITEVLHGDVEDIVIPWEKEIFDVLILSEVLEHLRDPCSVLKKIHPYLKPGAKVYASSPNVSHFEIVLMLLRGEWNMKNSGVMDETHLCWFTPKSYVRMFNDSGYDILCVKPVVLSFKAKLLSAFTFHLVAYLFWKQIDIRGIKAGR